MLNKINEYIKNNSLSNKVTILKNVKNAYPYYKFSSIFVVTSKYEGFCNVIVEASTITLQNPSYFEVTTKILENL